MSAADESAAGFAAPDTRDEYELHDDLQDAFAVLSGLPPRLQRIALLRALGLRQEEISQITGDSRTRVQHLITRASAKVYDVLAERAHGERHSSPRAERLWELEHEPPAWLTARIGRPPGYNRRVGGVTVTDPKSCSGPFSCDWGGTVRPAGRLLHDRFAGVLRSWPRR